MQNHSSSQHLGVFGWNFSFIGDIKLTTDSDGNVYIANSDIESILPSQLPGTALYDTSDSGSPLDGLIDSPYRLNSQSLLSRYSSSKRFFEKQADGSYQSDDGTLTWNVDHYELENRDGSLIVFRGDGQLNYIEDSNGYRVTANYTGDLLTGLDANNGDSFTLSYNSHGRIETITDGRGQTNTYSYDSTGQYLLGIEDTNGVTGLEYENPYDHTLVTEVTYDDGTKVNYDYDAAGRLQQVIYGEGREALAYSYSYDSNGGVTLTDSNGATIQQLRNDEGEISRTIDPKGRITNYSYDDDGNLNKINGELGFTAKFTYDDDGKVLTQTNALNQTTRFTYQANSDNLTRMRDARGNDVIYSYDGRGNLSRITYEDLTQDKYFYNGQGLLKKSVNRRGQEIRYNYNDNNQLAKEIYEDGSIIEYGYNADHGMLASVRNYNSSGISSKIRRFSYNQAENQLTLDNNIDSLDNLRIYSFDGLGRKTQITIQDGTNTRTTNYSYDSLGRLDKLTDGSGNLIVDYNYHPLTGQLAKETNGNGTETSYIYDLAGQLISLVNSQADGTVNSRFDYDYDRLGRRIESVTLDGTWNYDYDLTGQLTEAIFTSTNPDIESQNITYDYDAAGNRIKTVVNGVTENYSRNNLNQYESAGTTIYDYDLDGNLIFKIEDGKTTTYSYDYNNRLVEVIDGDSNVTRYEYDAFDNRTATIYNGERTEYLIDPFGYGDVIAEYDGEGNLIASYDHGIGLVSRTDASNQNHFYDFDAIGSTVGVTGTAGTNLNSYAYRPFGDDFYETETVANSFEYVGQWGVTEEANGLDFMRARYYDSDTGRFVASDPIGLQGRDSNFYRYGANNPVTYIDPEGTIGIVPAAGTLTTSFLAGAGAGCSASLSKNPYVRYGSKLVFGALIVGGGAAITWGGPVGAGAGSTLAAFGTGALLGDCPPGVTAEPPAYAGEVEEGFELAEIQSSPLVLDLDGDGIELTALDSTTVYFDIDGDGLREATGWVNSDDGLLVFDRNNDGYINDNSELFGNDDSFSNGFENLKALNTNGDNLINAADADFSNLQVWRDLDSDGRSDVNELFSLSELNIESIKLNYSNTNIDNAGNQIKQVSSYQLTNGTTREIVDAWFTLDQLNSYYDHHSTYNEPVVITEEILNLPNLRGYGNLPDLRITMATDTELVDLVEDFSQKIVLGQFSQAQDLVEPILFHWGGVDTVDLDSRGDYVDARKLEFLEKFIGQDYLQLGQYSDPFPASEAVLNQTLTSLTQSLYTRLAVQSNPFTIELDSPDDGIVIEFDLLTDKLTTNSDVNTALSKLEQTLIEYQSSPSEQLTLEASFLVQLIRDQSAGYTDFAFGNSDVSFSVDLATNVTIGNGNHNNFTGSNDNDVIYSRGGNDTLEGEQGTDFLNGGLGNDLLQGGEDNDTYIFEKGYGRDVIADFGIRRLAYQPDEVMSGGNDTLIFGNGITRDNLSWNFDGRDLVFSLTDSTNDRLTIQNFGNSFYTIEKIGISGDTLSLEEIMTERVWQDNVAINNLNWLHSAVNYNGLGGDDTITTGDFNDSLLGGNDNDRLTSNGGADTLRGGGGDDYLKAGAGDDKLWGENGFDTLEGGAGNDLLNGANGNDLIRGDDGVDTLRGGAGNDSLNGGYGNDLYYGDGGHDLLEDSYYNNVFDSDTLEGGGGKDTLKGGGGDDTYIFKKGYAHDVIADYGTAKSAHLPPETVNGGNNDTLVFGSGMTRDKLTWKFNGKDLTFSLTNAPANKLTIENYYDSDYRIENIEIEGNLITPEEIMTAQPWQDNTGVNSLNWSESSITYSGLGGDDTITTGDFDDKLYGDNGHDRLTTNGGADTLYGGAGDDYLKAGADDDILSGNNGHDTLNGDEGNDALNGDNGNDLINGGNGIDTLRGSTGNDTLNGGYGNDIYSGGDGHDLLEENYYNNRSDSDTLNGGAGNDTLKGGGNNDTYIFNKGHGSDLIADYGISKPAYSAPRIVDGGSNDTLIFGNGITRDNLNWSFEGQDLVFTLSDSAGDKLTIQNYNDPYYQIEDILVEGNSLTHDEIVSEA